MSPSDELIGRLRERASDPERRVDERPNAFVAGVRAMDPGALRAQLRTLGEDLAKAVEDTRAGRIDPELNARAERLGAEMSRRAFGDLPPRADGAAVARAEKALGFPLPPFLRRVYLEIANGGFGPGS